MQTELREGLEASAAARARRARPPSEGARLLGVVAALAAQAPPVWAAPSQGRLSAGAGCGLVVATSLLCTRRRRTDDGSQPTGARGGRRAAHAPVAGRGHHSRQRPLEARRAPRLPLRLHVQVPGLRGGQGGRQAAGCSSQQHQLTPGSDTRPAARTAHPLGTLNQRVPPGPLLLPQPPSPTLPPPWPRSWPRSCRPRAGGRRAAAPARPRPRARPAAPTGSPAAAPSARCQSRRSEFRGLGGGRQRNARCAQEVAMCSPTRARLGSSAQLTPRRPASACSAPGPSSLGPAPLAPPPHLDHALAVLAHQEHVLRGGDGGCTAGAGDRQELPVRPAALSCVAPPITPPPHHHPSPTIPCPNTAHPPATSCLGARRAWSAGTSWSRSAATSATAPRRLRIAEAVGTQQGSAGESGGVAGARRRGAARLRTRARKRAAARPPAHTAPPRGARRAPDIWPRRWKRSPPSASSMAM